MNNLKEVLLMYLKKDVLLLTVVLQNHKETCNSAYGINLLCSYSTPSFAWKAGWKHTGVELEYIADDRIELLLENNMRGRPSFCMGNCYVNRGERKLFYWYIINIYGLSMAQHLPTGDFQVIVFKKKN